MSRSTYPLSMHRLAPEDLRMRELPPKPDQLPTSVDLRPKMPPVYDQGTLGSCTANALMAAIEYDDPGYMGSRLFCYFNERAAEGDTPDDAGARLCDGVATLERFGVCPEAMWPYDISKFTVQPPAECYSAASSHKVLQAHNVPQDMDSMKHCLSSGFPFVVGITVFSSFESQQVAQNGVVPLPTPMDSCLGGHAVLCVGYDDARGCWIMRNSWSAGWGDQGYFYLPYTYLLDHGLATDLWTITAVQP